MSKKRMANMELLRILAMIMVVMLHYLSKGMLLPDMKGHLNVNGYLAWILETLSIVAVNVYMLISGFFLTESRFKCGRLIQLWCQILFYSLLVPAALLSAGILKPQELSIYKLLQYMLPVQMEQYWFATAYVILYLMTPLLRAAVKNMKQSQLKLTILLLLLFFSVSKSVLPVRLETDTLGYDAVWFICVYLCAAYMRLYGFRWFCSSRRGVLGYLCSCCGILGIALVIRIVYLTTGRLEDFLTATYHYNHILNLLAAISLFYAFYHWRIPEGRAADWICRTAPYTFGVYLFHEQVELRTLWPGWLGASAEGNPVIFAGRCIGSVLLVFLAGILVDMVRGVIFGWIEKKLQGGRFARLLQRADTAINGEDRLTQTAAERK